MEDRRKTLRSFVVGTQPSIENNDDGVILPMSLPDTNEVSSDPTPSTATNQNEHRSPANDIIVDAATGWVKKEGDNELPAELPEHLAQEMSYDVQKRNSKWPSCARKSDYSRPNWSFRASSGRSTPYVIATTDEHLLTASYSKANQVVIVAQQRPDSVHPKLNEGKSFLVMSFSKGGRGNRTRWVIWDPAKGKTEYDEQSAYVEKIGLAGQDKRPQAGSSVGVGGTNTGADKRARSTVKDGDNDHDIDDTVYVDNDGDEQAGQKRARIDTDTQLPQPQQPETTQSLNDDRSATLSSRSADCSLHQTVSQSGVTPAEASKSFLFVPPVSSSSSSSSSSSTTTSLLARQQRRVPLSAVGSASDLFEYALCCGVAKPDTRMLRVEYGGVERYVRRGYEPSFEEVRAWVMGGGKEDAVVTAFVWLEDM